jgi:hypothetical protein
LQPACRLADYLRLTGELLESLPFIAVGKVVLVRQDVSFQEQLAAMIASSGIRKKHGAC